MLHTMLHTSYLPNKNSWSCTKYGIIIGMSVVPSMIGRFAHLLLLLQPTTQKSKHVAKAINIFCRNVRTYKQSHLQRPTYLNCFLL